MDDQVIACSFSSTKGSSALLSFNGSAIAVYGTVSDDHANMRVTLNGQTDTFSAGSGPGAVATLHPQVLLVSRCENIRRLLSHGRCT
jgi:hypothetical protein